ncbi:uncharacterized protein LOC110461499 [Mizuhopecten yessoensis]|uniref:uncharacterized protein LOC110461499 n=1 Tax=Mizuhopecten yessoensis TaxID=6573 RepID=UPI000B45EA12|nr:uncharacterized protein LOC110461499 [Mizuhopecten yessoensis]
MEGRPLPNNSTILSLSRIVDANGVLRVGGHLNKATRTLPTSETNSIIVPKRRPIAKLIIRHFHESVLHQGRHITEGAVRAAGFWNIGGKRLVSSLIHSCVQCRRLRGQVERQKMSDLPIDRLKPNPPFTYVGVDTFGPWSIVTRKTRGESAQNKRWTILFTCLVTRAIHIEVVEELSSASFINALRRFTAIRGSVKLFRSDWGTNFVGAVNPLEIDTINVEDGPVEACPGACQRFLETLET